MDSPIGGFDPRAHALLGAAAAGYLLVLVHRWTGDGEDGGGDGSLPAAIPQLCAGLLVVAGTLVVGLSAAPELRLPLIVGAGCICGGLVRSYAAVVHARVGDGLSAELVRARSARWWLGTGGGILAGLALLSGGWTVGWFIASVPALAALGYGTGALVFACPIDAPPAPSERERVWASLVTWGGSGAATVAALGLLALGGSLVVAALALAAGGVLALTGSVGLGGEPATMDRS